MVTAVVYFSATDPESFLKALVENAGSILSAPGYLGHQLKRGVEDPDRILLLVDWESVEHHMSWQRAYAPTFVGALRPYMASGPEIKHYT